MQFANNYILAHNYFTINNLIQSFMYFPQQLATNKILGRFPVVGSVVDQINNPIQTTIELTEESKLQIDSPAEKQLDFYRDFMLDRKSQLNFSVPVMIQIMKLPEKYDNEEFLKLQAGDFWAIGTIAGNSLGLDVEIEEDGTKKYYLYFILDNPRNLYYKVDSTDADDIISKYEEQDNFLAQATNMERKLAKELSQNNLSTVGKMPEIKMTNPANKIHVM